MEIIPQAFTFRSEHLLNTIITPITVSSIDLKATQDATGLWDTGATGSMITSSLVKSLKLKPIGKKEVHGVHGKKITNSYYIVLEIYKDRVKIRLEVTECERLSNTGAEMLIGMDVIMLGDFAVTNCNNKTTMTYRIPPINEIDFVKDHNNRLKVNRLPSSSIPARNEKCPCGSGSKYKNCCGKNK